MSSGILTVRMGKKGVVVIPKEVRDRLGLREGSLLSLSLRGEEITLRPLRPRRIRLGARAQEIVSEIKREELELEEGG